MSSNLLKYLSTAPVIATVWMTITAGIIPWHTGFVDSRAWCLTDNKQPGRSFCSQHRSWFKRQFFFTHPTGAHFFQQLIQPGFLTDVLFHPESP